MDAGAARAALTFMLAADSAPVVSPAAVDLLMQGAARQDMYGRYPSDIAWLPTYDLHSAATEGWRWKAGALIAATDLASDGVSVHRSQAYDHAMLMVEMHRRRIRPASVRVLGQTADLYDRAQAIFDLSTLGN